MSSRPSVCATASTAVGDRVAVAHVDRVRVPADLGGDRIAPLGVAVEDRDGRALGREPARGRRADARRAAGDDRYPPVELRHGARIYGASHRVRPLEQAATTAPRANADDELGVVGAVAARPAPRPPRARRRPRRRCSQRHREHRAAVGVAPRRTGSCRSQRVVRGRRVEPARRRRRDRAPPRAASRPTGRRSRTRAQSAGTTSARPAASRAGAALDRGRAGRAARGRRAARPSAAAVGDGEVDRRTRRGAARRAAGGDGPSRSRTRRTPTASADASSRSALIAGDERRDEPRATHEPSSTPICTCRRAIAASVSGRSVGMPTMRSSRAISRSSVVDGRGHGAPPSHARPARLLVNSSSDRASRILSDRQRRSGDDLVDDAVIAGELDDAVVGRASRGPGC